MLTFDQVSFFDPVKLYYPLNYFYEYYNEIRSEYDSKKDLIKWKPMHWDIGYLGQNEIAPEKYMGWSVAPILGTVFTEKRSITYHENSKILTNITKIAETTRITARVGLLSLDPGVELKWHRDDDNPTYKNHELLRILWGLDIPEQEGREAFIEVENKNGIERMKMQNNVIHIFASHNRHRVVNNLTEKRVVVSFDIISSHKHLNEIINQKDSKPIDRKFSKHPNNLKGKADEIV